MHMLQVSMDIRHHHGAVVIISMLTFGRVRLIKMRTRIVFSGISLDVYYFVVIVVLFCGRSLFRIVRF